MPPPIVARNPLPSFHDGRGQAIAELHGIGVEVNFIVGLGTSFLLTFPPPAEQ